MPEGSNPARPCRTVLKSSPGEMLNLTLELAQLNDQRDFVRVIANNKTWLSNETCAPCIGHVIESSEIFVDFLLTNSSKFMMKYSKIAPVCPPLNIKSPLYIKNKDDAKREVGASVQLQCLNKKKYRMLGASEISCELQPNGQAAWNAPLPTCKRASNCPQVEFVGDFAGKLVFNHRKNEDYRCKYTIGANDADMGAVRFVPRYEWEDLVHQKGLIYGLPRGLVFSDGKGKLRMEAGAGRPYRTRDSTFVISFNFLAKDLAAAPNSSFTVTYEILKKECPAISQKKFPFGSMRASDKRYVGSSIEFTCDPTYKLVGESGGMCMSGGVWNFKKLPKCVPVSATTESPPPTEVSTEKNMEEERAEVAAATTEPSTEGHASGSTTVRPQPPMETTPTPTSSATTVRPSATPGSAEPHSTTMAPSVMENDAAHGPSTPKIAPTATSTNSSDHSPMGPESPKVASGKLSINPAVQWAKGAVERLKSLDTSKKQDQILLLMLIALTIATVFVLVAFGCILRYCCKKCRGRSDSIPIRENPNYTGERVRATWSRSFADRQRKRAPQTKPNHNNNLGPAETGEALPGTAVTMGDFRR